LPVNGDASQTPRPHEFQVSRNLFRLSSSFGHGILVIKEITFVLFPRFDIREDLENAQAIEESESGKGSFKMRTIMDCLARYGAHARPYVEKLQLRDEWKSVPNNRKLKSNWDNMIKAMEADKTPGARIFLEEVMSASGKK